MDVRPAMSAAELVLLGLSGDHGRRRGAGEAGGGGADAGGHTSHGEGCDHEIAQWEWHGCTVFPEWSG